MQTQQNLVPETSFIVDMAGQNELVAVFEDDGDTGYLYLYDSKSCTILEDVHVYDRAQRVNVRPKDVDVIWSGDNTKCGVMIWGKMRAIIDRKRDRPGRVWLESRDTPGVGDPDWLAGFEPHSH